MTPATRAFIARARELIESDECDSIEDLAANLCLSHSKAIAALEKATEALEKACCCDNEIQFTCGPCRTLAAIEKLLLEEGK